jgi:hypothetical protein
MKLGIVAALGLLAVIFIFLFSSLLGFAFVESQSSSGSSISLAAYQTGGNSGQASANPKLSNTILSLADPNNPNRLNSYNAPGTDNGVEGCVWAVNQVLQQAGYNSTGTLSTKEAFYALRDHHLDGAQQVSAPVAGAVTIIISPSDLSSNRTGHVGFVINGKIYSNDSTTRWFSQNYPDVKSWTDYFGSNNTYFFVIPPQTSL